MRSSRPDVAWKNSRGAWRAGNLAAALLEEVAKPDSSAAYNLACCFARIGERLAPGAESTAALDRAMALGVSRLQPGERRPDLDPLRSRPDFRLTTMNLAMPADPFARSH